MTITKADNGYMCDTHYEPSSDSKSSKNGAMAWEPSEKTVHPTANHLIRHIKEKIGGPEASSGGVYSKVSGKAASVLQRRK